MEIAVLFDKDAFKRSGWGEKAIESMDDVRSDVDADFTENFSQEKLSEYQKKDDYIVVIVRPAEGGALSGQLYGTRSDLRSGYAQSFVYLNDSDKDNLNDDNTQPVVEKINREINKFRSEKQDIESRTSKSKTIGDKVMDAGKDVGKKVLDLGNKAAAAFKNKTDLTNSKGNYHMTETTETYNKERPDEVEFKKITRESQTRGPSSLGSKIEEPGSAFKSTRTDITKDKGSSRGTESL